MLDNISSLLGSNNNITTKGKNELGKNDFLQLMLTQLKFQDPLEPVEGSDFSAQLAQFSSLEQLSNMSEALTNSVNANYQLTQSINNTMIAAFIGKEVKLAGNTLINEGQDQSYFGFTLPANVKSVKIEIRDESGNVIKTMEDLPVSEGDHKFAWDFTNDDGELMAPGNYYFSVTAQSISGNDLTVQPYRFGVIDAIRFTDYSTALVVNDIEYSLSDVFEIINPVTSNSSSGSGR